MGPLKIKYAPNRNYKMYSMNTMKSRQFLQNEPPKFLYVSFSYLLMVFHGIIELIRAPCS